MKTNPSNLVEMLDSTASKYPNRVALIFGAKRITYKRLIEVSKKLSSALYELGIRKKDKVALWLFNCPEFVYSFFAVLRLKAIVVPVNSMFKREEARFLIEDSKAKILICSVDKIEDAKNILSRLNSLNYIISVPCSLESEVIFDFYRLVEKFPEFDKKIEIEEDDLAEIVYTSGTTGKPKGACLTHKNLLSNVEDCSQAIRVSKKDCFICILPLFHSFASTVCMLLPIYNGAKIVIMRAIRPFKRVLRAIFKHRVTIFCGVPSIYAILSETKISFFKRWLNIILNPIRLYISGAAALPYQVWEKFEKKFKRVLLQGYGLTEASPVVSLNPLKKKKPQSVGIPLPSIKVKVINKEGKELKEGEIGELLVKGPNVMKGYYNMEEETKKVLKDGWLYTGDLAKIDKDGFIYIMGRIKEMINVRGLNVYPKEIEDLLYKYPSIKEAAVVGVEHKHRGEVPVAFVVKEREDLTEKEVMNYLRANLASYKVPLRIFFKENLPKNPTGKILKRELEKEVKELFK
jgi:long-chain acyl-CoA synthetase